VEVVASLSQGRTAAAQCGLFTYKSVPVIFEPPCSNTCTVHVLKNVLYIFHISTLKNIFCSCNKPTNASAMISFKVSFSR